MGRIKKTHTFTNKHSYESMSIFHTIKVLEVKKETADCVSVAFDIPQELKQEFTFSPGQYLTLEAEIEGELVRRSYSLCTSPFEDQYKVAIKKVQGGKFSTFANHNLMAGQSLKVMPPQGNFKLQIQADSENHYVAFAAGSGITPILSMIKATMVKEPLSKFTLFFGNRNFDSIIFREEVESLKNKYLERLSVHHILSKEKLGSPLFFGRIDAAKCKKFSNVFFTPSAIHGFYLCGPSQMIFSVKEELINQGVNTKNIHFELFNTDGLPTPIKEEKAHTYDADAESKVTIVLDGESFNMPLGYEGLSILDGALAAGADLPYACKGGVCSTCKARITEGEAIMDINYALEPDEVKKGFVLTCQAHPRTSTITVDFDEA